MRKREVSVRQIVATLGRHVKEVHGSPDVVINNICDANHTDSMSLDWVGMGKGDKQGAAERSLARVVLVDPDVTYSQRLRADNKTLVVVDNPKVASTSLRSHRAWFMRRAS